MGPRPCSIAGYAGYGDIRSCPLGCGAVRQRQGAAEFPTKGSEVGVRGAGPGRRRKLVAVSTVEQPAEPPVGVYAPEEALRRARPLPPRDLLVLEDVADAEWQAFLEALAEA